MFYFYFHFKKNVYIMSTKKKFPQQEKYVASSDKKAENDRIRQ